MNKRIIFTSFFIILSFVLSACQQEPDWAKSKNQNDIPSSAEGITLEFEQEKYETTETEAQLVLHNDSEKTFLYGEYYSLEKNVNGIWYEVLVQEDMFFSDIGYFLPPNQTESNMIDLTIFEEELSPGHYRVIKNFQDNEQEYSSEDEIQIAASFELIEP